MYISITRVMNGQFSLIRLVIDDFVIKISTARERGEFKKDKRIYLTTYPVYQ